MPVTEGTPDHQTETDSRNSKRKGTTVLAPLLLGGLSTVAFYAAIPYLPVYRELAERYFFGHPLEFATAALFFIGIATLGLKAIRISAERSALQNDPLYDLEIVKGAGPLARCEIIQEKLAAIAPRFTSTHLTRRIRDVNAYIRGRGTSDRVEEHLKYLAELASERLHDSYGIVRTITWAVPIIGFLGTVIGITIAIANVTPEQLDTSLNEVTGGLAVAFDTTALALTLSLLLVFATFLVEHTEQNVLSDVEEYGTNRIACLFPTSTRNGDALINAETQAAEQLLQRTEVLIDSQTELWQNSLELLRQRWVDTLEHQQHRFDEALGQGMEATLSDHSQQLATVRGEFLHVFREAAAEFRLGLSESLGGHRELQTSFGDHITELWNRVQSEVQTSQQEHIARADASASSLSKQVAEWQSQLQRSSELADSQLDELRKQREMLLQLVGEENKLTQLQTHLVENLEAVRATETFEDTMHSLSAAVHLLAARAKPRAA